MAKTKEELKEYNRLMQAKRRAKGLGKTDPQVQLKANQNYMKKKAGEGFKSKYFTPIPENIFIEYQNKKPENMTDIEFFTLLVQNYG